MSIEDAVAEFRKMLEVMVKNHGMHNVIPEREIERIISIGTGKPTQIHRPIAESVDGSG